MTNPDEPYFLIESLDTLTLLDSIDDRSYKAVIFSVNQKGRSPKTTLKDFFIGENNPLQSSTVINF